MLSACFGAKMPTLYSGKNSGPVVQKGIFVLPDLFLYFFFHYRIFHLFMRPLNIISTSFHLKMVTLYSCRNSWPVRTRGIFLQIFHNFFFFFRKNFPVFLLDHEIWYMHVSVQKCRHSITVKILDQFDKRAFSYKYYPIYFVILFYFFFL